MENEWTANKKVREIWLGKGAYNENCQICLNMPNSLKQWKSTKYNIHMSQLSINTDHT